MRVEDLELKELLEINVDGGLVRFAGQRALIFDAVAQGMHRKELIDSFGVRIARGLLTRFGYVHGQRMAEAMRTRFKWATDSDWRRAGSKIYALQGLFVLEPGSSGGFDVGGGTWHGSYEAEQHLLHIGQADYPVCWSLCGLASGYLSCSLGKEVYAVEDRCTGKGDPACHVTVKTAKEWGDTQSDHSFGFKRVKIDAALLEITEMLKRTERELSIKSRKLAQVAGIEGDPTDIIARSPEMQRVMKLAMTCAKVKSTVLITGESGTGKERIASFVHDNSACADGPFVAINCGAISGTLLESELFGHTRGAFTGAASDRPGLFEAANGGTLFLDEVGEMSLPMQVKLLRALQEREVRRVGENKSRPISVRIVAATNKDLGSEVAAKRFRKDLYDRLKLMELVIPPLRNRREDILPLARVLLAKASLRMKRAVKGISGPVADHLLGYRWPGNVRELANAMERGVAVSTRKCVDLEDLPLEIRQLPVLPALEGAIRSLEDIEKQYILAIMESQKGNRNKAAIALKIGVSTLQRKLKCYGMVQPEGDPEIQNIAHTE